MEQLTSTDSTTASESLLASSPQWTRDIAVIKQKLNLLLVEHSTEQEWSLLAHTFNRLFAVIYSIGLSVVIAHHFSYQK
jgi:hypothetical protein